MCRPTLRQIIVPNMKLIYYYLKICLFIIYMFSLLFFQSCFTALEDSVLVKALVLYMTSVLYSKSAQWSYCLTPVARATLGIHNEKVCLHHWQPWRKSLAVSGKMKEVLFWWIRHLELGNYSLYWGWLCPRGLNQLCWAHQIQTILFSSEN